MLHRCFYLASRTLGGWGMTEEIPSEQYTGKKNKGDLSAWFLTPVSLVKVPGALTPSNWPVTSPKPCRPQCSPSNSVHFCCCSQSAFSNRTTYSITVFLPKALHGSSGSVLPAPRSSLKHFLAYMFYSSQVF